MRSRTFRSKPGLGIPMAAAVLTALALAPHPMAAASPASAPPAATNPADPAAAATVYKEKCSGCHAADGSGSTPVGKSLKTRDLRLPEAQAMTDAALAAVIAKGKGKMPAFGTKLSSGEITALVAYVRTLAKPKG